LTPPSSNAVQRLIGMVRSPHATLTGVIANPRSLDLAILVLVLSTICSVGFLLTRVGELAALDQQVRQLESFGALINDDVYAELRRLVPYRPLISAAMILVGWPVLWLAAAGVLQALGNRFVESLPRHPVHRSAEREGGSGEPQEARRRGKYAQVLTIIVHASAIFAVRALIAAPINYARESLGGATSLSMLMPSFGESTFSARLLGAVDIFVLWWVVLVAMGMSILYETPTLAIARWLVGAYAAGAVVLALTQALRGGI
jgi:Yip1-like protein